MSEENQAAATPNPPNTSQDNNKGNSKSKKKKKSKKTKKAVKGASTSKTNAKAFQAKSFPTATFETVLPLAQAIFDYAGALREMKRDTVFGKLSKSPTSGPSRTLITNSSRYGLTIGGYQAEILKLSEKGILVVDPSLILFAFSSPQ